MQFTKSYLPNVIQDWLDRHGYEQMVDPTNPDLTTRIDPMPEPWRIARQFVQAAQAKDLAAKLPEGRLKVALVRSSSLAVSQLLDDTCGTPPRR
jgi:hypothetical protein